ncbi:MAG: protein nirF, partial [Methylococcales bacterium]|nr:protein nirF [Methylococcales bacterium]
MNNCQRLLISTLLFLPSLMIFADCGTLRGTGDLLLIIERMTGSVVIAETTNNTKLCQLTGLGDLSHASVVYSRDQRYAFVFGRDGGLTKIDMLLGQINKRIIQSGNPIGGAISQDGSLVAVSNYTPGGVNIFSSETLELVAKIPTPKSSKSKKSRVVGLTDAPDKRFVFSLFDTGEIWIANMSNLKKPEITKFTGIGKQPYDGLITPDGRHYIAGLFGEDGLALLDLWHPEKGIKRILGNYGKGQKKLPVYKMPHLEGWAIAGNHAFLPAVGQHKVMVVNRNDWTQE